MPLKYLNELGVNDRKYKIALYECDCGNTIIAEVSEVKRGRRVSCGCYKRKRLGNETRTHGLTKHPLYKIWASIIQRCEYKKAINYERYGGRGVRICNEWRDDFKAFYEWAIKNGWKKGLEIDKDIKAREFGVEPLVYSPEMCSVIEPNLNKCVKRNTVYLEYNGVKLTLKELAGKFDIPIGVIKGRYEKGWDVDRIIGHPIRKPKRNKKNKQ